MSSKPGAWRARVARRWAAEGGYREFLKIALPLILSTASWSIQHFVDRVFLTWHSTAALAAALPAGVANFTFISLFMGTVQYVNTFVAQRPVYRRAPTRTGGTGDLARSVSGPVERPIGLSARRPSWTAL